MHNLPFRQVWQLVCLLMNGCLFTQIRAKGVERNEKLVEEAPLSLVLSPGRLHRVLRSSSFNLHLVETFESVDDNDTKQNNGSSRKVPHISIPLPHTPNVDASGNHHSPRPLGGM